MIRKAVTEDAQELTRISFASKRTWRYPEDYYQIWKDELTVTADYILKNDVWVTQQGNRAVGYGSLVHLSHDVVIGGVTLEQGCWLDHMFIDPPFIGKGLGRNLFTFLLARCSAQEISFLQILADPHSFGFYKKTGCTYVRDYPSSIPGRTTPFLVYGLAVKGEA